MTKKLLIGSFFLGVLIVSCKRDITDKLPVQNKSLQEKVIAFMDAKKAKVGDSAKAVIEKLKNNIDWSDFSTDIAPYSKKRQTTFTIKKENTTASRVSTDTYTSLYVTQNSNGNVVQINTLEIDIPNGNNGNLNSLALNLVNNNMAGYTGALVKRNLSGYYIYEIDINNGTPTAFKYMKKRNLGGRGQQAERTESCLDWYWQTYVNGVLVSEVFLFQDCSQGVEEGSSGSGGGNGNGNPPDSTINPCTNADSLETDIGLQTYLAALHSVTNSNYEVGVVKGHPNPPFSSPTYQIIQGTSGNPSLPSISPTVPIYGVYHSHFAGGFSIFSPQDIRFLYNTYSDSMATAGFTYAVTTSSGTYVLQVSNVATFLQYGAAHFEDEANFTNFETTTYANNNIWETGSHDGNEAGFLRMIANENMGLTLLSSESPGFNEWDVKGLSPYGSSINLPC